MINICHFRLFVCVHSNIERKFQIEAEAEVNTCTSAFKIVSMKKVLGKFSVRTAFDSSYQRSFFLYCWQNFCRHEHDMLRYKIRVNSICGNIAGLRILGNVVWLAVRIFEKVKKLLRFEVRFMGWDSNQKWNWEMIHEKFWIRYHCARRRKLSIISAISINGY